MGDPSLPLTPGLDPGTKLFYQLVLIVLSFLRKNCGDPHAGHFHPVGQILDLADATESRGQGAMAAATKVPTSDGKSGGKKAKLLL